MDANVSDFILERLRRWGVRRIFGYPGDGINGIVGALGRAHNEPEFVQARHEEMAAFMASAHAKFTGETGVCLATSGPGAIHLLNGLYDAKADHQPVVALVGQQKRASLGGDFQQEVDLQQLFSDVAHAYVHTAMTPAQVRHLIDRAFRIARAERTVTCVIFPNDVQELPAEPVPPREHGAIHSGAGYVPPCVVPAPEDLERAAGILNGGERVAMLVGAGALHATDEIIAVAERLGAGVAKALLGKAAVPDELPFVTGAIGLLGTQPSWEMMSDCDTLLMVGSAFPYSEFLPAEGQARGVQIDIDARMLNLRYPMQAGLCGDSAQTLSALLPMLHEKQDTTWRKRIEGEVERWWRVLKHRAMSDAKPINPQRVFWELSKQLPEGCIVTSDSGTVANWYARDLRFRRGMMGSLSGGLASMGAAVPYALAAKMAHPDRAVIALEGDGAMQMNGINELITIADRWRDWADPRLVVLVLNNGDLNQVTWELRGLGGSPRFAPSQALPAFRYADYGQMLGLLGLRVEQPDQVAPAWEAALRAERPTVLEVVTDPDVPPLPPHITMAQAGSYASALAKGDANAAGVIRATIRESWESLASRWTK